MDTKPLVIQCTYSEDGKDLADITKESFRIFLQKELHTFVTTTCNGVS